LGVLERPVLGPVIAAVLTVCYAVVFWLVVFVFISWELFQVPMGLGGAIYPALFLAPVTVGSVLWQAALILVFKGRTITPALRRTWMLWIPAILASALLVVFCPMDEPVSYIEYVWQHIW
jgi:hypothetical protein